MAESEEINLRVNVVKGDTKTVKETREELDKAKKAAEETGKSLNEGLKTSGASAMSLRAQLKAMVQELGQLDPNSARFKQLSKDAGELKDRIGDINERVNALSSDTKRLDSLVRVGGAIAGGFQAANGAMALFGGNSEKVAKAIQNIIAVQGVLNGVQQVGVFLTTKQNGASILDTTIKYANVAATKVVTAAQWLWNAALTANPIGLVVVAVGALSLGIYKLAKGLKDGTITIEDITKVLWRMLNPLWLLVDLYKYLYSEENKLESSRQKQKDAQAARTKQRIEEIKAEQKAFVESTNEQNEILEKRIKILDNQGKSHFELRKQILENNKAIVESEIEATRQIIAAKEEQFKANARIMGLTEEAYAKSIGINNLEELRQQASDTLESMQLDVQVAESEITKLVSDENKKRSDSAKDRLDKEKALAAERYKAEQERLKNLQMLEDAYLMELEKAENDYFDSKLTKQQKELQDTNDYYFGLIERGKQFNVDTAVLEEARNASIFEINERYRIAEAEAQEKARLDKEAKDKADAEKRISDAAAEREEVIKNAETLIGAVESLNSIAADREIARIKRKQDAGEKLTKAEQSRLKRQEAIQKAFAIAQIAIDTARGISAAVAAGAGLPFPANIPAIISGVAAVLSGIAAAKKALGEGGGGVDSANISDTTASVNEVKNQEPQVQDLNNSSTILNQEPQKVYVVESEMTAKQNKVKAIISEATF
jgi:hypothetical protein